MSVLDRNDSPWTNTTTHARLRDRGPALAHPRLDEILHVAEHVVQQDPTVKAHLAFA